MAWNTSILIAATELYEQIATNKDTTDNYKNFHYASSQLSKCVRAELFL